MSKKSSHWSQTLITIGTILPVILVLGGWLLARSNNSAVLADQVSDLNQEVKALQAEQFKMELLQAKQSCKP